MSLNKNDFTAQTELANAEKVNSNLSEPLLQEQDNGETVIDLVDLFYALFHKLHYIVLSVLIGTVILNAYSYFFIKPTYQSTAKMYVVSASSDSVVDLSDINVGSSLTLDYEELVLGYPVLSKVIDNLDLDWSVTKLKSCITIENPEDTRILNITATTTDPRDSMRIANEVMDVSIKYLPDTMSTNAPNVAERARLQETKVAPNYGKYTLIGALLGLVICCGIIIARHLMDDTIHTADDMEKYFGITPLTVVPENQLLFDGVEPEKKSVFKRWRA
ncbi:MAG: Wzz/FepE/Etk N-terminal domain-containing protein [Oscillospiraceae bacterium]|nr:Wzz/FepE/Etk N-terminal domain-containing protein [Oscillospiraceae bacterium]